MRQAAARIRGLHILKTAIRAMEELTDVQRTIVVKPDAVIDAGPVEIEVFIEGAKTRGLCRVLFVTSLTGKREDVDWEALSIVLTSPTVETTLPVTTDEDDPSVGRAAIELPEGDYRVSLVLS